MATNEMRIIFGQLGFVAPGPEILVVDQGIHWIEEIFDLDDAEEDTLLKFYVDQMVSSQTQTQ